MGTDRDRQGRVRVRLQELGEIPPMWHVRIGECVHDMRSALDHVAFRLNAVGAGGVDPPSNWKASQFPIYSRRADFRDMTRLARSRKPDKCPVRWFPHGARAAVERLQPYHRRKDPDTRWLEVLAELSNIDKHREFPMSVAVANFLAFPREIEGHAITNTWTPPYRPLKPNATIARFEVPTLPRSVKQPQVNIGYGGDLCFDPETPYGRLPLHLQYSLVWYVLGQILLHIRERVVPALEPFLG